MNIIFDDACFILETIPSIDLSSRLPSRQTVRARDAPDALGNLGVFFGAPSFVDCTFRTPTDS